ncbi:putative nuclease HARBI1 [Tanacetum coccineum]
MKRTMRESASTLMFKEFMSEQNATHKHDLQLLLDSDTKDQVGKTNIDSVISVMNRMVKEKLIEECDDLWCFGMIVLEDPMKREFFLNFPVDACMMNKILNGNLIRCVNAFGMHPTVFMNLYGELESKYGLKSSDRISVVEKLGVFVYILAVGVSNRDAGERFQRSGETISRAFHEVLEAITGRGSGFQRLAHDIIRPKDPSFRFIPSQIMNDQRYMPYFKDCIGCIDGTHIGACIPENQQVPYIGRKGVPTFNVMANCDFDMCFTFISVGWEGSAHDTRVFLHALNTSSLNFPKPPRDTINLSLKMSHPTTCKKLSTASIHLYGVILKDHLAS